MNIFLNGVPSTNFNIIVSGVQRQLLPARAAREISVPGYPGTYDFGSPDIGKREFKFVCHFEPLDGLTMMETAQTIALWLRAATTMTLDDQPDIAWAGRVLRAADLDNMVALGKFAFTFEAQPYAEDISAVSADINAAVDYGSPLPFAPLITVTMSAAASSLQVQLLSTGELVRVADDLEAGDVVAFDMSRGLVTVNGLSAMPKVTLDSRFFAVPPGTQSILTTPDTGLAGQITYKRRYL